MRTLIRKQRRFIPWLIGCSIAALASVAVAQSRPSIAGIDAKLDLIDGKVDTLLAASISGGGVVPVTLIQRVNPDNTPEDRSGDTTQTLRLCIGLDPCTTFDAALANRIRQGTDEVLVVTSITAQNFAGGLPPVDGYGLLSLGACETGFFPRLYGVPFVAISGRAPTHVTFDPGVIVADLSASQRLCFASLAQSTVLIDATLHGYLVSRP